MNSIPAEPALRAAVHLSPASRLAAMLRRYEANRATVFEWLDRSWIPSPWADYFLHNPDSISPDCAHAMCNVLSMPVPSFSVLCAPDLRAGPQLGHLPVAGGISMLRVRALFFRREELRRMVGRAQRTRISDLIGDLASSVLPWAAATPGAPDIERLGRTCGIPSLNSLSPAALSWEGFCLFVRDGLLNQDGPAALLRFALPRELDQPHWLTRCERGIDANGSSLTLDLLPELFPEVPS
jgi:type III secretion system HrpB4-like protein